MGRLIDLTGRRFGRLTVLERGEDHRPASNPWAMQVMWRCRCDCGAETLVMGVNLRDGSTKSCGCLRAERCARLGKRERRRKSDE